MTISTIICLCILVFLVGIYFGYWLCEKYHEHLDKEYTKEIEGLLINLKSGLNNLSVIIKDVPKN